MVIQIEVMESAAFTWRSLQIGNVYPVRGGSGLRHGHMFVLIARTADRQALFLRVNKSGAPIGVAHYGEHVFADQIPIAYCDGLTGAVLTMRPIGRIHRTAPPSQHQEEKTMAKKSKAKRETFEAPKLTAAQSAALSNLVDGPVFVSDISGRSLRVYEALVDLKFAEFLSFKTESKNRYKITKDGRKAAK